MLTHRYEGFEKVADTLQVMHEKPADLIKPVAIINW
jgi:hypothetical protein